MGVLATRLLPDAYSAATMYRGWPLLQVEVTIDTSLNAKLGACSADVA